MAKTQRRSPRRASDECVSVQGWCAGHWAACQRPPRVGRPMSTSSPLQGGRLHPRGLPVRPPHLAARAACATALASDFVSHGTGPTGNIPKDSTSPCLSGVPGASLVKNLLQEPKGDGSLC